jgi:hypothetical protein
LAVAVANVPFSSNTCSCSIWFKVLL